MGYSDTNEEDNKLPYKSWDAPTDNLEVEYSVEPLTHHTTHTEQPTKGEDSPTLDTNHTCSSSNPEDEPSELSRELRSASQLPTAQSTYGPPVCPSLIPTQVLTMHHQITYAPIQGLRPTVQTISPHMKTITLETPFICQKPQVSQD